MSHEKDALFVEAKQAVEETLKDYGFPVLLTEGDGWSYYEATLWEADPGNESVVVFLEDDHFEIIGVFDGKEVCHKEKFKIVEFKNTPIFVTGSKARSSHVLIEDAFAGFHEKVTSLHEETLGTLNAIETWESKG